jgi:hypothetical protein
MFDNCKSLYGHLTQHQFDATLSPTLEDSIEWLQMISDSISQGLIK